MIGYLNLRFRREYKLGYCLGYFKFDTNNKRNRQQNFILDRLRRFCSYGNETRKQSCNYYCTTSYFKYQNFFILFRTMSTFLHHEEYRVKN